MTPHSYRGLALLYLFWAVALCSRAIWQYMTHNGDLLPTHLSLVAGFIYVAIVVWAWYGQRTLLISGLIVELMGVLIISIGELLWPLSYASAWSQFGSGYLYMPIILPILGLLNLSMKRAE
jgi:hypothetical protein